MTSEQSGRLHRISGITCSTNQSMPSMFGIQSMEPRNTRSPAGSAPSGGFEIGEVNSGGHGGNLLGTVKRLHSPRVGIGNSDDALHRAADLSFIARHALVLGVEIAPVQRAWRVFGVPLPDESFDVMLEQDRVAEIGHVNRRRAGNRRP